MAKREKVATSAEEVSNRVGGQEGLFLYFEIASVGVCQCQDDKASLSNLSWPKIKQGYVALEKLYGLTNLNNNRFAYMAYSADDKAAAQLALSRIGENIDPSVWRNRMTFQPQRLGQLVLDGSMPCNLLTFFASSTRPTAPQARTSAASKSGSISPIPRCI